MASAAQRRWAAKGRAEASSAPASTRIKSSVDRARGGKSGTVPMPRSGDGVTREEAILKAAEIQYGKGSSQAKAARSAVSKAITVPGVIGGVKAISDIKKIDPLKPPKYPHGTPLTTAQIHQRETLFGGARKETLLEALKGKSGEITKFQVIPTEKIAQRARVNLQSSESKLQTNEAQLFLAEQRLGKWDKYIKDGAFVGTELQYNRYVKDFGSYQKTANRYDNTYVAYSSAFDKADTTGKQLEQYKTDAHRAKYGGLIGTYEDAEIKAAELIATSKTQFKEQYPLTTKRINSVAGLIKEVAESQVVGHTPSGFGAVTKMDDPVQTGLQLDERSIDAVASLAQREFASGLIQQAGKKPIKTAAMVGVGLATGPALKGVGVAGKALGAGRKVSIAGKGVLYGMGGMYVIGTGIKYTQAGTPRERGAVVGEAIFQEIVPLFVGGYIGTKAITAAPKVSRVVSETSKRAASSIKAGTKEMLLDDTALAKMATLKPKVEGKVKTFKVTTKPKTNIQRQIESAISRREAQLKRPLFESEVKEIKRFYEMKIPKTQQEVIIELKAEAMNKRIDDIVRFRNQHLRIYEGGKQEPTIKQMLKSVSDGQKPSVYEPIFKQKIKTVAQVRTAKLELKALYKNKTITKAEYNKLLKLVQKQEASIKLKIKGKTDTTTSFSQQLASVSAINSAFKEAHASKTKAELKPKQKVKPKAKVLLKPKTKAKTATIQKQKARTAQKATQAKKARAAKAKAQPKKLVKPLPPTIPKLAKRTKPKAKPKTTQYVIYSSTQLNNRVASLQSLFG